MVCRVRLDHLELQVCKVRLGLKVCRERQEILARQDPLGHKVLKEIQALPVLKV